MGYDTAWDGFPRSPRNWECSSFHRYVSESMYDPEWEADVKMEFEPTIGGE